MGLDAFFVANSTAMYFELATNLALNRYERAYRYSINSDQKDSLLLSVVICREFSYGLRVKLLDAIDSKQSPTVLATSCSEKGCGDLQAQDSSASLSDMRRYFYLVVMSTLNEMVCLL